MSILDIIHKGKGIKKYKRSYHHPLLHRNFYCDNLGHFTITKMWNIKIYIPYCEFLYEKDNPHLKWVWKVEIKKDSGKYIVPLVLLFEKNGLYEIINGKDKKISDENMFIFYK